MESIVNSYQYQAGFPYLDSVVLLQINLCVDCRVTLYSFLISLLVDVNTPGSIVLSDVIN